MKMILDGTPEEIAEMLKRIKAVPTSEKSAPLQTDLERISRETGTVPWYPGPVTCGCVEGISGTTGSGRVSARNG